MPQVSDYNNESEWMAACVPVMMEEGKDNDQAVAACLTMWRERGEKSAVKAVGDWELDVLAVPFGGKDSDGQWFDANTDIMEQAFSTPLAVYQHGTKQGAKGLQEKILLIGKTVAGSNPGARSKK